MKNKKVVSQVGAGIIAMTLLLLVGAIFMDDSGSNRSNYSKNRNNYSDDLPESYIFYLKDTDIGRQKKTTNSFPNFNLGSKEQDNIIYMDNAFNIKSTPFSKIYYSFTLNFNEPENIEKLLIYGNLKKNTGKNELIIRVGDKIYYKGSARNSEFPLIINYRPGKNVTSALLTIEIDKPPFYSIFNWNSYSFSELKVVEKIKDKSNHYKEFSFSIDDLFLERVETNLVVNCDTVKIDNYKPIKIEVNNYTLADFTPNCTSHYNRVNREIPLNILKTDNNKISFKTDGYYTIGYSINSIFYNDKDVYKFNINNFNNVIDIVMYGDFDSEVIDIRLNSKTMSLRRNEIKSIIQYLRYGTNELKILTKPLSIKELIIETNDFY